MKSTKPFLFACAVLLSICCSISFAKAAPISSGDTLPDMFIPASDINKNDAAYLGFERGTLPFFRAKDFLIHNIDAEVVFIEFFNIYCTSCQAQAPVLNTVYSAIKQNPELQSRVKFIGIGAGNNEREITRFKSQHGIQFPLIPDPDFKLYELTNDPGGTPFSIIAKKIAPTFRVVSTHLGLQNDPEKFINEIKFALKTDAIVARVSPAQPTDAERRKLDMGLTEEETIEKIRKSITAASKNRGAIINLNRLELDSGYTVYASEVKIENREHLFYSVLLSRNPVCDICHGVHFIVTFDRNGTIQNFLPIHLTKYGNVVWNESDVRFTQRRLEGMSVKKWHTFNRETDAVSFATMTSALIFNSINQLGVVLDELEDKRRRTP